MAETLTQRVRSQGVRSASSVDLIAIGFSRREQDASQAENMSRELLKRFRSIHGMADASADDIREVTGLEGFEAMRCQALLELGRRVGSAGRGPVETIQDAADVYILLEHLRLEKREYFYAILLDSKNGVMRTTPIHVGTLNASLVGAREVFREAIRDGACSLIVAHNHPSGDPTPSPEDLDVTDKLVQVGALLDIPLLDHVIIGDRKYVSLHEMGHMA